MATFTAAVIGAVLAALLSLGWPRFIFDWMRVIHIRGGDPPPAPTELAVEVAAFIVIGTMLLSAVILAVHSVLRRLGIPRPWISLAFVSIVVFALAFVAEAAHQVTGASGNLRASDATGFMIDDGRLTPHGWETIARRAAAASLFAGVIAASFGLVRSVHARRRTDP